MDAQLLQQRLYPSRSSEILRPLLQHFSDGARPGDDDHLAIGDAEAVRAPELRAPTLQDRVEAPRVQLMHVADYREPARALELVKVHDMSVDADVHGCPVLQLRLLDDRLPADGQDSLNSTAECRANRLKSIPAGPGRQRLRTRRRAGPRSILDGSASSRARGSSGGTAQSSPVIHPDTRVTNKGKTPAFRDPQLPFRPRTLQVPFSGHRHTVGCRRRRWTSRGTCKIACFGRWSGRQPDSTDER
jgi:hypothetical protein